MTYELFPDEPNWQAGSQVMVADHPDVPEPMRGKVGYVSGAGMVAGSKRWIEVDDVDELWRIEAKHLVPTGMRRRLAAP